MEFIFFHPLEREKHLTAMLPFVYYAMSHEWKNIFSRFQFSIRVDIEHISFPFDCQNGTSVTEKKKNFFAW